MEFVRNKIAENFGGPTHSLVSEENYFDLEQVPDLSGKIAVVTGGSEGIGFGVTHTLLSKNISKLFVRCRCKPVKTCLPDFTITNQTHCRSRLFERKSRTKRSRQLLKSLERRRRRDSSGCNVTFQTGHRQQRSLAK